MRSLCLFSLLILWLTSEAHNVQIAAFELTDKNTHIQLNIKFETSDLVQVWPLFEKLSSLDQQYLIHDYLVSQTRWQFDDIQKDLCNLELEIDDNHTVVKGVFYVNPKTIKQVEVRNTCLISVFADHINLINLDLNDRYRGFRMDKNRKKILVEYVD